MKCKIAMEIEVTVDVPDELIVETAEEFPNEIKDGGGFIASVAARRQLEKVFGEAPFNVEDYIEFDYFDQDDHLIEDIYQKVAQILGKE